MPALAAAMDTLHRLKRATDGETVTQAAKPDVVAPPAGNNTAAGAPTLGDKARDMMMNELKKIPCKNNYLLDFLIFLMFNVFPITNLFLFSPISVS